MKVALSSDEEVIFSKADINRDERIIINKPSDDNYEK